MDVLGRPLALARRDEIPPCTHGEALRSPCTIRSRSRGRGGGWICAYRRSRGRSGTGTGPRRRPRCRSPTAAGSAATTPTPTTPPPAPAAPPSTIHRSLPPRSYNPPPPIRNPSSSSSSPRSIDRIEADDDEPRERLAAVRCGGGLARKRGIDWSRTFATRRWRTRGRMTRGAPVVILVWSSFGGGGWVGSRTCG